MTFRIPAGKHRARPLRFGLYWNRNQFKWHVLFTERCRYDLHSEDQFDTNKLIGIGYLPGHHKDSARFGWRYDTVKKQIELSAYCYVNGRRVIEHIGYCEIDKWYKIRLQVMHRSYLLELEEVDGHLMGHALIEYYHEKKLQYRLGCYFGGNRVAPTEMKIKIERL